MARVYTIVDYANNFLASSSAMATSSTESDICLRINLDSMQQARSYEQYFMQIVAHNPNNITQFIIYGSFDDQESYGFGDLLVTIFQHVAKLTYVRTFEINSVKLDYQLVNLLCKVIGTMEQRMLLYTIRLLNCQLGSQHSLQVVMALKSNTNLKFLDISSNFCGDSVFPLLQENMTKFEQTLNCLSFCHDNISDPGVEVLASVLSSQKVFIHELYLSHNPKITAASMDSLFICAMQCNRLHTLSLAGCSIAETHWARFLPFIRCLHTLDVSHNLIDDDALIVLGHSLRYNTSVTHLNLSHNRFVAYGGHIFESLLHDNACLITLNIACNPFRDKSIWKSLGLGLSMNRVLLSLDISDTALTLEDLLVLGNIVFVHNTTLMHLNLEDNFLPLSIAHMDTVFPENDIRPFLSEYNHSHMTLKPKKNQSNNSTGTTNTSNLELLPLSATAEIDSANASLLWIEDIRAKVQASIEVNAIVDVTTGELRKQTTNNNKQKKNNMTNGSDNQSVTISTANNRSINDDDNDSYYSHTAADRNSTSTMNNNYHQAEAQEEETEDFERKMYHPSIIQHSSYYLSPEQLNERIVRDMQELYSTFYAHLVYIAWGRAEFVLGAIEIDVHLTYQQVRPLVTPFVQEYMSTVAATEQDGQSQFYILSAAGDVTDHNSLYQFMFLAISYICCCCFTVVFSQNRSVWADVRHVPPAPLILLRPANWIRLDD